MGAFQDGFRMGQAGYQQARDNEQREKENERLRIADERATTRFDNEQADRTKAKATEAEIEALGKQLTNPNAANYSMASGAGPGMRMQGAEVPATPRMPATPADPADTGQAIAAIDTSTPVDLNAAAPAMASGPGMRMQGSTSEPGTGFKAQAPVMEMGAYKAPPTRGAAEDIMAQRALLRGDDNGYRAAQNNKRAFDTEDLYSSKLKEYTGAPEQVAATAQYMNQNSKAVTMGTPDKNGLVRISVVKPDGNAEFMKLTKQDQAKLYAAGHMMQSDPVKAIELMAGVNKELAAAVAAENGLVSQVAGNTNDVSAKSASIDHGKAALALQGQSTAASVAHSRAQTDLIKQTVSDKKDLDDIRTKLNDAIESGDEAAIKTGKSKLMNYMQSGKSGMQNMSPQERAANFYLASGAAKTLSDAARMSHEKVQASPGDDYMKLMTPNSMGMSMKPEEANAIMTVRHGPNWKAALGGEKAPVAGTYASNADAEAAVKAGKIKPGDRVTVNGVSGTWK